jgi:hypothetical protein
MSVAELVRYPDLCAKVLAARPDVYVKMLSVKTGGAKVPAVPFQPYLQRVEGLCGENIFDLALAVALLDVRLGRFDQEGVAQS